MQQPEKSRKDFSSFFNAKKFAKNGSVVTVFM
jgi:hypothetical protein